MRIRKVLNVLLILVNIFMITGFILAQVYATEYFKSMFWASIPFFIAIIALDINEWSKIGLDIDKEKSRVIKRSFDDSTALLLVFYVLLFLIIYFFQQFDNRVFQHNYVIIGFFIMTLIFELFMYLSVNNAKRDTAKLLEEQH